MVTDDSETIRLCNLESEVGEGVDTSLVPWRTDNLFFQKEK